MASWNPFKREAETLKSISQEIQRSEAPTWAIGKLSTKVRSMIDAVASRIRSVVGGKVVITGARSRENIDEAFDKIYPMLESAKKKKLEVSN